MLWIRIESKNPNPMTKIFNTKRLRHMKSDPNKLFHSQNNAHINEFGHSVFNKKSEYFTNRH